MAAACHLASGGGGRAGLTVSPLGHHGAMTTSSADVFDHGLTFFDGVVSQVPDGDWDNPSPCEGWTALDVLGHLGTSLNMGASLLHGEQPTWPTFDRPSELVEGEPVPFYRAAAQRCRDALVGADLDLVMDTPMGKRTVADRLAFPAIDLYVTAGTSRRPPGSRSRSPWR
jgi:uncharacterized protein (TIGR03083 family)